MADDDLAYLTSLSEHPNRAGDVSNFNPAFAGPLANAMRQARAAGFPVGVMSGFREPTTGSAYDAGGNSSHGYGLASDISGLDGPNGKITNQWAQIAAGQRPPQSLRRRQQGRIQPLAIAAATARANPATPGLAQAGQGDRQLQNVWQRRPHRPSAAVASRPAVMPPSRPSAFGAPRRRSIPASPSTRRRSPARMRNSSPITPIDRPRPANGARRRQRRGLEGVERRESLTPPRRSTSQNGQPFSFGDFQLNVRNGMGNQALAKGIDPRDPNQWQSADRFAMDQMKAGGLSPWKGDADVRRLAKRPGAGPDRSLDPGSRRRLAADPWRDRASRDSRTSAAHDRQRARRHRRASVGQEFHQERASARQGLARRPNRRRRGGRPGAAFNFTAGAQRLAAPADGEPDLRQHAHQHGDAAAMERRAARPGPLRNAGGQPVGQQFGTSLGSLQQMRQIMAMMGSPYGIVRR